MATLSPDSAASDPPAPTAPAQPFTGVLRRLQEVAKVPPETVVLVRDGAARDAAGAWSVRHPGDTLVPAWNPFRRGPDLLPVNVGRVGLRVEIPGVTSYDGEQIRAVVVRVDVQLSDADDYAGLVDLVRRLGPDFGIDLMAELRAAIEAAVRGALRMTPPDDLEHQGLTELLDQRWLPRSFLGGAVVRRGLEVLDVAWPPPVAVAPRRAADPAYESGPSVAPAPAAAVELSLDVRLRRVWRSVSAVEVRGIAGAYAGRRAAVVVVTEREPSAYEFEQAREAFAALYGDPSVMVAVTTATDLEPLVAAWLAAADRGYVRLVGVDVLRDGDLLRIRHAGALAEPGEGRPGRPGPDGPEVEALRRLVPHRRVELAAVQSP